MLDQLFRDYTSSIAEAEEAVAQTIGNLRISEDVHSDDVAAANVRSAYARAASQKGDLLHSTGQSGEADKFDNLAKIALGKQIDFENEAKEAAPRIATQGETVEKHKTGLVQMKAKLGELQ